MTSPLFCQPLSVPSRTLPLHFLSSSSLTSSSKFTLLPPSSCPTVLTKSPRVLRCCAVVSSASSPSPVLVVDDDKYGRKEVISLTPELYKYLLANVREPEILRALREETATMRGSQMQKKKSNSIEVSPEQAQMLSLLVQILGAERCIELGVYTGYSSLSIALALPDSGYLVACERDPECIKIAQKYYELAGVSHKVEIKPGLAVDALRSMILNGETCSYDFAFIDADKRMYEEYFELLLQLVRVGGLIVVDNVLWHGRVADPLVNDPKTISVRKFNSKIFKDKRVSISMVPIGDGITICRKLLPS